MVNGRTKGHDAEREIARELNRIVDLVREENGRPRDVDNEPPAVQRNQMQSAVGGDDLTGTFHFSIEVKRQEELAIETWWKQCVKSAERQGKIPVLMYKQNRKKWKVLMPVILRHPGLNSKTVWRGIGRAEVSVEDFYALFMDVARHWL